MNIIPAYYLNGGQTENRFILVNRVDCYLIMKFRVQILLTSSDGDITPAT